MGSEPRDGRVDRRARLVAAIGAGSARLGAILWLALVMPAPAVAQVSTELTERSLAVGERFAYVVTIEHEEPADVEIEAPAFPGVRLIEGPSVRPISTLSGGDRERAVEVRFVYQAVTAGRYVLPEVPVLVAGQPYLTEPRLLEIGEARNRSLVPFLARWTGATEPLVAGEARVYTLEIYNATEFLYPSSISVGTPGNAIFEEVQGLGSIERSVVDDVTLYAIPVAVFMVTPSQAGTVRLPEARVATDLFAATAGSLTLPVTALPAAAEASGAVGRFTYEAAADAESVLRTGTLALTVRIAGTGNLHLVTPPEPTVEGMRVERTRMESSLLPTPDGYEGWVERRYTLRPDGTGEASIAIAPFAWYDPSSDRVVREPGRTVRPEVIETSEPIAATGADVDLRLLTAEEIGALERRVWYRDAVAYGWLVPGVLVLIAVRIFRRSRAVPMLVLAVASLLFVDATSADLPWEVIELGMRRSEEGNLPAAISAFERAARSVPDSPGVNYNLAVLYFRAGDVPRSLFAAREAIRLAPLADEPRVLLETVEFSAGIERSVPPPHLVHPDLFFLLLALLVNAFFIGAALIRSPRGWSVIVGILLVVLIAGAGAGLATSALRHGQQVAVVRDDVTLRRIPGSASDGWLPIQQGAAVRVVARNGNSLLVRTVLGLDGWLELEDVIWPGSPLARVVRFRGFVL